MLSEKNSDGRDHLLQRMKEAKDRLDLYERAKMKRTFIELALRFRSQRRGSILVSVNWN